LTLHNNEGNYLAHTQGKRHQTNLARRGVMTVEGESGVGEGERRNEDEEKRREL
jgi:hypothetical protein